MGRSCPICAGAAAALGYLVEKGIPDCDDTDPTVQTLYYQDLDGDGYAASTEVSACGNAAIGPPPGFGLFVTGLSDCDDHHADVNPDAIELWGDTIDSDCDGSLSPYNYSCADGGACEPVWPAVLVDPTCGSADLVIAAVEADPICYGVYWTIWIGNQGTQSIQSFLLRIESPVGRMTFAMTDSLAPGTQYPYRIPSRLHPDGAPRFPVRDLEGGDVRFTLSAAVADCNLANNTASKAGLPIDCMF